MNYRDPARWNVDHLCFEYQGVRYSGHGFIVWEPDKGITVEARIQGKTPPDQQMPKSRVFRAGPWVSPYTVIHATVENSADAVLLMEAVPLFNMFDGLSDAPFWTTLRPWRMLLRETISRAIVREKWTGVALVENQSRLLLPDWIHETATIGDHTEEQGRRRILRREFNGLSIDIRPKGKHELQVCWTPPSATSRRDLIRWGRAIRDALSLESSSPTILLHEDLYYGHRYRQEYRRRPKIGPIIATSMLTGEPLFNAERFLGIVHFLADGTHESYVAHRLIREALTALQLPSGQDQDMAVATTFEAALRTLERNTRKNWGLQNAVGRFCQKFNLGTSWTQSFDAGISAWNRLRHRNAHPDWLSAEGGAESNDEAAQAMDDRNYLLRLYGYMILAMADVSMENPRFPLPVKRPWKR